MKTNSKDMAKFVFVGKISKSGNNHIIWIPKEIDEKLMSKLDVTKQIKISLDDDFLEE